jgi:hypothetical protein
MSPRTARAAGLALIAVLGTGAAACSSSTAPGSAPASQPKITEQGLLAFSRCMRSHGVRNFPDVSGPRRNVVSEIRSAGISLRSSSVRSALRACRPQLPGQ